VGSPKRNSSRMMPQSGRQLMPRCHVTGSRPESSKYPAMPLTTMPATAVPTAAPAVPNRGRGPRPVMNATLHAMFRTVRRIPRRSGVRASPAARKAPLTMKKSSIPRLPTNMIRRNGSASTRTAGAAFTTPWSPPMRFCSIVGHASIQTARASGPSTIERSSGLPPPLGIQAPRPRPGGGEIKPDKAEQDGGMPLIEHRPKALWRVAQEIRDRHLARENEGHRPREQSDEEEQAAKRLEHPGDAGQRRDRRRAAAWHDGRRKREQLRRPELYEEKGGDDPEDAEQVRRPRRPFRG